MIEINGEYMSLIVDGEVIAHARPGGWVVSTDPARLFTRNDAITALKLAERLAAGFDGDDPFVIDMRADLGR